MIDPIMIYTNNLQNDIKCDFNIISGFMTAKKERKVHEK
jgi:hypothetical protein